MRKNVLIVAYYFPPLGMGGVQRVSKLAKYLPQFGYSVDVLTVKPIRYLAHDATLLDELSDEITIHRAGSTDPARLAHLMKLPLPGGGGLSAKIKKSGRYWPDSKIGWKKKAVALAGKIIRKKKIDVILSSSPPMTAHLVAEEVASIYNIKWVADFRDFWESLPPEEIFGNDKIIRMSYDLMHRIHDKADAITRVNDAIGSDISNRPVTVQGGFDPDDFKNIEPGGNTNQFLVTYLGSSGPLCPLDNIIKAIGQAVSKNSELSQDIKIKIIGKCDAEALEKCAAVNDLSGRITYAGYLDHRSAIKEASSGHLSLISLRKENPGILPGKIFDLLPLAAPVLAVVPTPGEAAKVCEKCNAGVCVDPDDVDKIAEALLHFYDLFKTGASWDKKDIDRFSRITVAGQFAEIFDRITDA